MKSQRLILSARLNVLRRGLIAAQCAIKSVEEIRARTRQVPGLAEETGLALEDISTVARKLQKSATANSTQLSWAKSLEESVKVISDMLSAVAKVPTSDPLEERIQLALGKKFLGVITGRISDVDTLSTRLATANTPLLLQGVWTDVTAVFKTCEESFAEYVELLAGLALRDTRYDGGIGNIADQVMWRQMPEWNSLTIPAHLPRERPGASEFIHLSFPEWTPWALPLAAYDLGRFELARDNTLEAYVAERESAAKEQNTTTDLRACVCDAIATYLMGPAYAWASIIIRFDPADPATFPTWSRRLTAILNSLRAMDKPGSTQNSYGTAADQIQAAWNRAVAEVGANANGLVNRDPPNAWMDRLSVIKLGRQMPEDDWPDVAGGAATLRAQMLIPPGPRWQASDRRKVLNAAWLVRVEDEYDLKESQEAMAKLSEEVLTVLNDVKTTSGGGLVGPALGRVRAGGN